MDLKLGIVIKGVNSIAPKIFIVIATCFEGVNFSTPNLHKVYTTSKHPPFSSYLESSWTRWGVVWKFKLCSRVFTLGGAWTFVGIDDITTHVDLYCRRPLPTIVTRSTSFNLVGMNVWRIRVSCLAELWAWEVSNDVVVRMQVRNGSYSRSRESWRDGRPCLKGNMAINHPRYMYTHTHTQ